MSTLGGKRKARQAVAGAVELVTERLKVRVQVVDDALRVFHDQQFELGGLRLRAHASEAPAISMVP